MIIYIIQYNTWNPWIENWLYGLYHLKSRTFFSLIPWMTLGDFWGISGDQSPLFCQTESSRRGPRLDP